MAICPDFPLSSEGEKKREKRKRKESNKVKINSKEQVNQEIIQITRRLENLDNAISGLKAADQDIPPEMFEKVKTLQLNLSKMKTNLKRLESHSISQKKYMKKLKTDPSFVKQKTTPGRNRKYDPSRVMECMEEIVEQVDSEENETGCHEKRRKEEFRTHLTLNKVRTTLQERYDINLSNTTILRHSVPRRKKGLSGRRHVANAKVRFAKGKRSLFGNHVHSYYCLSDIKSIKKIAQLVGHTKVFESSLDDKAVAYFGCPLTQTQEKVMCTANTEIKLPPHTWSEGKGQGATPSCICAINNNQDKMSERKHNKNVVIGPLVVTVRPLYLQSDPFTHFIDHVKFTSLPQTKEFSHYEGEAKPVEIHVTDGGSDVATKNLLVRFTMMQYLISRKLQFLFHRRHAPDDSPYNRVERSMSQLTKYMAGNTIPLNSFGVHLKNKKTIVGQEELEKKNLDEGCRLLAALWDKKPGWNGYDLSAEVELGTSTIEFYGGFNNIELVEFLKSPARSEKKKVIVEFLKIMQNHHLNGFYRTDYRDYCGELDCTLCGNGKVCASVSVFFLFLFLIL